MAVWHPPSLLVWWKILWSFYQTSRVARPWFSWDPLEWTTLTLTIKISSSSLAFLLLNPGLVIFVIIFLAIWGLSFTLATSLLPMPGELQGIYWRSDKTLSSTTQSPHSSSILANEASGSLDILVHPPSLNSLLRNDIWRFVCPIGEMRSHFYDVCLFLSPTTKQPRFHNQVAKIRSLLEFRLSVETVWSCNELIFLELM